MIRSFLCGFLAFLLLAFSMGCAEATETISFSQMPIKLYVNDSKEMQVNLSDIEKLVTIYGYSHPEVYERLPSKWALYSALAASMGENGAVDVSLLFDEPAFYELYSGLFKGFTLDQLVDQDAITINVGDELPQEPIPSDAQDIDPYNWAAIGKCQDWMDVHSSPGEDAPIDGKAYMDETIAILDWSEDGQWCKVIYNNGNALGWVSRQSIVPAK